MASKMVAPKPYDLTLENRKQYLYASVHSDSTQPIDGREYLKDIAKNCAKTQCTRLVIENDLLQSFKVWDMFAVATHFPKIGVECTKVAVIDKFAPIVKKKFSIVVGRECGIDVQVFTDLTGAERWLLDNKAKL